MKGVTVKVGGVEYSMRPWTVGQLERIANLSEDSKPTRVLFDTFAMAMIENAVPAVDKPRDMVASVQEINDVIRAVNSASSIEMPEADEGEAEAGAR